MTKTNDARTRIVLVDDHKLMREGIRRLLLEYPDLELVGEAASADEAVEIVALCTPKIVIMDIHLPGMNGIDASARILERFPATKVVVLSGDADLVTVRRGLQVGISGYVTKGNSPEELLRAIRDAASGRVYLSPEIASIVVQDYMKEVVHRAPADQHGSPLSTRDRTLLQMVAEGKRNKEIASALGVEVGSVETYRSRLMKKLNCATPAELTRYAIREGIISP